MRTNLLIVVAFASVGLMAPGCGASPGADHDAGAACTPECSGETPHCNPATNTCRCTAGSCAAGTLCVNGACMVNGTCVPACEGATPLCVSETGACVCTDTSCPDGQICDQGTCRAAGACEPPCSGATPSCDEAAHACTCTDTSCPEGQACVGGACQLPPACDPSCTGETPQCDLATLKCVCTATSCAAQEACIDGACVPQGSCTPACSGQTPFCNPANGACVCTGTSCPAGTSCDGSACVAGGTCDPPCSDQTPWCDPGTSTCACTATSCTGGQVCSASGECTDSPCSPACAGATPDCNGAHACVCNESSCPAGKTCDGSGKCVAATCSPACAGKTPSCDLATVTCKCTASSCGASQVCVNGACSAASTRTLAEIADAADRIAVFIEANKRLPNYVTLGSAQVSMPSFLWMLVSAVKEIDAASTAAVAIKAFGAASAPKDTTTQGQIQKAELVKFAGDTKTYMDQHGSAPSYLTPTTRGTYLGYTNLVYMFSEVMQFYKANARLPNYVTLTLFSAAPQAAVPAIVKSLRTALGGNFTTATGMYNLFKKKLYKYYYNDIYTQSQEITRLANSSGLNCVDSSQIGHAGIMGLNQMGKHYTVDYVHATFHCGGHVFMRIKGEEFGSTYTWFDLAGAEKYDFAPGNLMCSGSMWSVHYNEGWIVSDDGN